VVFRQWTALLLIGLVGCGRVDERPIARSLNQVWSVPVDGTFHGLRSVDKVALQGDTIVVLDALAGRIHLLSRAGAYLSGVRLPRLADGAAPNRMAAMPDRSIVLASSSGPECFIVTVTHQAETESCWLPDSHVWRADLLAVGENLIVTAHVGDGSPVRLLVRDGDRFKETTAFGSLGVGAAGPDSAFFSYGLGPVASSGDSAVVFTPYSPIALETWSEHAELLPMAPAPRVRVSAPSLSSDGSSLVARYEVVTGLVVLDRLLLLSAYDPDSDVSSLWQVDDAGGVTVAELPLRLRVRSGADSVLLASRRLGTEELVLYHLSEIH
jgi:hypothetical protein